MEHLVNRARAAMNLILATTLVAAWAAFLRGPEATAIAYDLFTLASSLEPATRPPKVTALVNEVEVRLARGGEMTEAISELKVATLLSLSDVNLALLFGVSEHVTEEQRMLTRWLVDQFVQAADGAAEEVPIAAIQQLVLSAEAVRFRSYVRDLERLFAEARVREDATVGEIDEKLRQTIKIPFVDQVVPTQVAVVTIALGLVAPLLYLISVVVTIRGEIRFLTKRVGCDWVFFHSGWLGPALGMLWILSPAIVLGMSWAFWGFSEVTLLLLSLLLALLGACSIREALTARRAFVIHLKSSNSQA